MDQLYIEMLHMIGKQLERLSLISSNLAKSRQLMVTTAIHFECVEILPEVSDALSFCQVGKVSALGRQ